MIAGAGSGHPGGSLSAIDLVTYLYFHRMRIDPARPDWDDHDLFVLSKGHCCPAYYAALAAHDGPAYMRLGRQTAAVLRNESAEFEIGKAIQFCPGRDVALIAHGNIVEQSLIATAELARQGIEARVLDCHTIKPLDEDAVLTAATETRGIVTAEDHNIIGGLGSAVAEVVSEHHPCPVKRTGLRDTFARSGRDYRELLKRYGMTAFGIVKAAHPVVMPTG